MRRGVLGERYGVPMHAAFISYSHSDHELAEACCNALEDAGIPCWMAPRDVVAGETYPEQIVGAISSSKVCVLLLSAGSNASRQVRSEIELAFSNGVPILPFRIEAVSPTGDFEYLLAGTHWLDAGASPRDRIAELVARLRLLLERYAKPKARPRAERDTKRTHQDLPSSLTTLVGRDSDVAEVNRCCAPLA